MRSRSGRPTSKLLSAILFALTLAVSSAAAQSVCPIKAVKLPSVRGFVVENSSGRAPVPNVLIELRSSPGDEILISSTRTDGKGKFDFGLTKKGTYALDFRHDFFASFRLIVKSRGSIPSAKGGSVLVLLGPTCFETDVLLVK